MNRDYVEGYYSMTNTIGLIFRVYDDGSTKYRWSNENNYHDGEEIEYTIHGDPFVPMGTEAYMLEEIMRIN